ncbi:MAG TPA: DNA-3-methyladenine glycosylase [Defluviitaleaceae bacterium]|jgi:DNA-3-methyladenine glycosylase|nr:DNA-3-methyladenine glycosylase [Candidatus Epulonipiscium sp.]HOA80935.1 DNA-3-methyladenine glycosylase [Defluviitaleaceae bacterium]
MKKLDRSFYNRDTLIVARELLGKYIIHKTRGKKLIAKIVETEAYKGAIDKAAHSYQNKRTPRTQVMFGPPGHAYVYLIYGMYLCMNIVTEEVDKPCAVLLRAVEPIEGLDEMAQLRFNKPYEKLQKSQRINLTNGPGKLSMALNIRREENGIDLCKDKLFICEANTASNFQIGKGKRINIDYAEEAADYPWRFYIKDNPYLSVKE